jgi:hypothetical protein
VETITQLKITGYRQLKEAEVELMNDIKAAGAQLETLCLRVSGYLKTEHEVKATAVATSKVAPEDEASPESIELRRFNAARPGHWAAIGNTRLQEGLMALTRAVAQPTTFWHTTTPEKSMSTTFDDNAEEAKPAKTIIGNFKLDLRAVDEGQWVGDIPDLPGVSFRVRGSEYEPYQAALRRASTQDVASSKRERVDQLRKRSVDQEAFLVKLNHAIARHLLIGWDGIYADEDTLQSFTEELALEFMTNRAYKAFREGVQFALTVVDSGAADHREEAAGN